MEWVFPERNEILTGNRGHGTKQIGSDGQCQKGISSITKHSAQITPKWVQNKQIVLNPL